MEFENADGDSMKSLNSEEKALKDEVANQPAYDPNNNHQLNDSKASLKDILASKLKLQ